MHQSTTPSLSQTIWPPYSWDVAPCDFWLFPKLRGCCYETIEEMKEAVMKVIDMLTQEDFYGTFQKLLVLYNKYIAAGGDYFEEDYSFMCVLSIKVPIQKKSGNLFNDPYKRTTVEWTHYYDVTIQYVNHKAMGTPSPRIDKLEKNRFS